MLELLLGSTYGDVAKWQGRGLQSPYPRFESGRRLQECAAADGLPVGRSCFRSASGALRTRNDRLGISPAGTRRMGASLSRVLQLDALRLFEATESPLDIPRVGDVLDRPLDDLGGNVGIALTRLSQGHGCSSYYDFCCDDWCVVMTPTRTSVRSCSCERQATGPGIAAEPRLARS